MPPVDWVTRALAWSSFAAWVWAAALMLRRDPARRWSFNWWWLAGAVLMLVHTFLAFHRVHDWSHAAAIVETARQTRELTGVDWGGGVWLNYLFAFVWLADSAARVLRPQAAAFNSRAYSRALHGFMIFMWFNATVVFGSPPLQLAGGVAFLGLGCLAWRSWRLPAAPETA